MQFVRTIIWVFLLFALLAFSFFNWKPVEVQIWSNLVLETKLPALVIVSFLLGLIPMWLVHRGSKWQMKRRINALETAASRLSASAAANSAPSPAKTTATAAPAPSAAPTVAPTPSPVEPANPVDPQTTKPE